MRNTLAVIFLIFSGCATTSHSNSNLNSSNSISYKQVYVGFNGPKQSKTYTFNSIESVKSSWLASAIPSEIEKVLSSVDFNYQILIAAAVGERQNVTQNVSIVLMAKFDTRVTPFVAIGVTNTGCNPPTLNSYPFVLVVIEKSKEVQSANGYDHQNYADECKPVMSGLPHD